MKKHVRFGENLKILRGKLNLSQAKLAEKLCVERQTISSWERNAGKPDVYALANICTLFNLNADDLLFGKDTKVVETQEFFDLVDSVEQTNYISSIQSKGFYDIVDTDIQNELFPFIYISFPQILGIAVELKKRGYIVTDIYSNGFSIYFPTDAIAQDFSGVLYDIIEDGYIHGFEDSIALSYADKAQKKLDLLTVEIIDDVIEEVFDSGLSYYWIDEYERIRGHGKSKEDCKKQASEQGCINYMILKN